MQVFVIALMLVLMVMLTASVVGIAIDRGWHFLPASQYYVITITRVA